MKLLLDKRRASWTIIHTWPTCPPCSQQKITTLLHSRLLQTLSKCLLHLTVFCHAHRELHAGATRHTDNDGHAISRRPCPPTLTPPLHGFAADQHRDHRVRRRRCHQGRACAPSIVDINVVIGPPRRPNDGINTPQHSTDAQSTRHAPHGSRWPSKPWCSSRLVFSACACHVQVRS